MAVALAYDDAIAEAIERAERSVVAISRVRRTTRLDVDPTDPDFIPNEFATGVILGADGLIVTNDHVLGDPRECDYYVWHNRKAYKARIKAEDPWLDLAVLQIEASGLAPMPLGDAASLRKGQTVIALGNPYAIARDGDVCASRGVVANLSRPAPPSGASSDARLEKPSLHHYGTLIHTDVKLHLGTSGGALVNLKGELVGLTTSLAARAGYEAAAGYAVPVNDVFKRAVDKLKEGRTPEYGFLGVGLRQLADSERKEGRHGARVTMVLRGTPGGQAGLAQEDIITHVNGAAAADKDAVFRLLGEVGAGEEVRLTFVRTTGLLRRDRVFQPTVKLAKKHIPTQRPIVAEVEPPRWRGMQIDYSTAMPSLEPYAHLLDPDGCVAAVEVEQESAAWRAGVRPWMFIKQVDGRRVTHPDEFFAAVAGKSGNVRLRLITASGDSDVIVGP